tara:strand:- start:35630 stop:35845 length:216 start_codon:yes stop_codon:yes gene_type:complete
VTSEIRKAQLREAQKNYRAKQKALGRKPQPFLLSDNDHKNIEQIIKSVESVKNKEQSISYALSEAVKNIKN